MEVTKTKSALERIKQTVFLLESAHIAHGLEYVIPKSTDNPAYAYAVHGKGVFRRVTDITSNILYHFVPWNKVKNKNWNDPQSSPPPVSRHSWQKIE